MVSYVIVTRGCQGVPSGAYKVTQASNPSQVFAVVVLCEDDEIYFGED